MPVFFRGTQASPPAVIFVQFVFKKGFQDVKELFEKSERGVGLESV